jgi:hypothetical protein
VSGQTLLAGPVIRLNKISNDRRRIEWLTPPTEYPLPLLGNFNLEGDDPLPVIMPIGEICYTALMPDGDWWILAMIEEDYAPERGEDFDVGIDLTITDANLDSRFMENGVLTVKDATLDAVVAYVSMGASAFDGVFLRQPPERDRDEFWSEHEWENFQRIMTEWAMVQAQFIEQPVPERP